MNISGGASRGGAQEGVESVSSERLERDEEKDDANIAETPACFRAARHRRPHKEGLEFAGTAPAFFSVLLPFCEPEAVRISTKISILLFVNRPKSIRTSASRNQRARSQDVL